MNRNGRRFPSWKIEHGEHFGSGFQSGQGKVRGIGPKGGKQVEMIFFATRQTDHVEIGILADAAHVNDIVGIVAADGIRCGQGV